MEKWIVVHEEKTGDVVVAVCDSWDSAQEEMVFAANSLGVDTGSFSVRRL